jgi:nitric oxide reductase activation protein
MSYLGRHLFTRSGIEGSVRPTICSLALFLCSLSISALTQTRAEPPPVPHSGDLGAAPASGDEATERIARDMAKKANQERAAAVKSDTEKLLKLAVELKASVDKSNENVLSVDVIKKAEEIEKLAHSVKDKMKGPN